MIFKLACHYGTHQDTLESPEDERGLYIQLRVQLSNSNRKLSLV